ncbi:Uncharacterized protein BM_BM8747 [Brugia malayi]|uniref:Major facilitator superfamily (MFS) profile domain-containing protein n=1 Tax=Brugia malayi TaxID=6279 RepID=A0A4E9FSX3_BRUMA|nr:Uncharacterized protein BM_BM8747 [Brugia malayi]VIO99986.1 Uncharacterized protein BM_BM8747 [Brugia malayi]
MYDTQTCTMVIYNSCMHDAQTYTIVGVLETFVSLGSTAGPLFGGVLYELGFKLPFIVLSYPCHETNTSKKRCDS